MAGLAKQRVSNAGKSICGVQFGENGGAGFRLPVDGAVLLFHQLMRLPRYELRLKISVVYTVDRSNDCLNRCFGGFVTVN